jgi:integrase
MSSIRKLRDGRFQAQFRPVPNGRQVTKTTRRKADAQQWLDAQTAALVAGTYVSPRTARTTVDEWCDTWLDGYRSRRPSTVRQARVHIAKIREGFGPMPLSAVRPSHVRSWTARLRADGLADSYVYACHSRLSQIFSDAVHDGIVARNPCSRRTSPKAGKQRPYCATTEQVWAIYDAFPEHLRPAVLLGAFVGLRTAEACGLRTTDVDFMRGVVSPEVQYPAEKLKSDTSRTSVPIPAELALELSKTCGSRWVVTDGGGWQASTWAIERAVRSIRSGHVRPLPKGHSRDCAGCLIPGLPADFHFHDLRHYFASLLIASGADVKIVQARLRHASAKTTLDTYSHLWPDADESTRAAVGTVLAARMDSADELLTNADAGA